MVLYNQRLACLNLRINIVVCANEPNVLLCMIRLLMPLLSMAFVANADSSLNSVISWRRLASLEDDLQVKQLINSAFTETSFSEEKMNFLSSSKNSISGKLGILYALDARGRIFHN